MGDVSLPYRLTCHSETFNVACSFPSGSFQVITSAGQHPTFVLRNAHVLQLPCGVRVGATLVVVGFFGRRQRGEGSSECSKFYGSAFDTPLWRIHPMHRAASLLEGRLWRRGSHAGWHQRWLRSLEDRDSMPRMTQPFASALSPSGTESVQRSPTDLPARSFGDAMGAGDVALVSPSGENNKTPLHSVNGHRSRKSTRDHRLAGARASEQSGNEVDAGTVRPVPGLASVVDFAPAFGTRHPPLGEGAANAVSRLFRRPLRSSVRIGHGYRPSGWWLRRLS